ncbi:hypothetical protein MRX96_054103 [Rhipicephalus microplus]
MGCQCDSDSPRQPHDGDSGIELQGIEPHVTLLHSNPGSDGLTTAASSQSSKVVELSPSAQLRDADLETTPVSSVPMSWLNHLSHSVRILRYRKPSEVAWLAQRKSEYCAERNGTWALVARESFAAGESCWQGICKWHLRVRGCWCIAGALLLVHRLSRQVRISQYRHPTKDRRFELFSRI